MAGEKRKSEIPIPQKRIKNKIMDNLLSIAQKEELEKVLSDLRGLHKSELITEEIEVQEPTQNN